MNTDRTFYDAIIFDDAAFPHSFADSFHVSMEMFIYQKTNRYFAQVSDGMQAEATEELTALGATRITPAFRGIHFSATRACLYRINYMARIITRVLAPLVSFRCPDTDTLYKKALDIDWPSIFRVENTFAVFANVSRSNITHSQYAGLKLKDAVADRFRRKLNRRPDVNPVTPDVWINLYIHENNATISLDTSGGSLHRRGYRKTALEAPMQETLAAEIIRLSEWNGDRPLYDPMCGSGTLLTEALMHYCQIPAGHLRTRFGFSFFPDFDSMIWHSVRSKADRKIRPLPQGLVSGSDISAQAVDATRQNAGSLPHGEAVEVRQMRFQDIPAVENSVIVSNPPYGMRMGDKEEVEVLIKELGDFLKQRCRGTSAYIYFGDRELIKKVGLRPAWKKPLRSGGLDGRLVKYELY